jgi:WD40 repeat protein
MRVRLPRWMRRFRFSIRTLLIVILLIAAALAWDSKEQPWQTIARFPRHHGPIRVVAISPNEQWVVSVSEDGVAHLSDMQTHALAATLEDIQGAVRAVAISTDGEPAAMSEDDRLDEVAGLLAAEFLRLKRRIPLA